MQNSLPGTEESSSTEPAAAVPPAAPQRAAPTPARPEPDKSSERPKWTEKVGAIAQAAQVIALITAAVWTLVLYLQTREAEPRADVVQDIISFPLNPDYSLVHVNVRIKNISKVVIEPKSAQIKLQQICPLAECGGPDPLGRPCPRDAILSGGDLTINKHPEAPWPELGYKDKWLQEGSIVLEPGETSMVSIDFLVPSYVSLARIFTFISEDRDGRAGWPSEAIYKLPDDGEKKDEVCGSSFGSGAAVDRKSSIGTGAGD